MHHTARQASIAGGTAVFTAAALLALLAGRSADPAPIEHTASQLTAASDILSGGPDVADLESFLHELGLGGLVNDLGLENLPQTESLGDVLFVDAARPWLNAFIEITTVETQLDSLGQVFDADVQGFFTNFDLGDFSNLGTALINDVGPDLIGLGLLPTL